MNVNTRFVQDNWILDISGRIDRMSDSVKLKSNIDKLLEKNKKDVILNLSKVTYLDSGALNVIISVRNNLEKEGNVLKLLSPNEYVKDVIEVVGLHKVIKIYYSEKELEENG